MKKIALLLILISSFSVRAQTSDEQQIKDLIQNSFDEVISELNLEAMSKYYTDDFLLLEVGEVWDLDRLRSELKAADMDGVTRINKFDFIEVKVNGNSGWIAYHNNAILNTDDQTVQTINWLESATAIRTEAGWRLDMLHSTRIGKDPRE